MGGEQIAYWSKADAICSEVTEWSNNLSAETYGDTVIPAKGGWGVGST